jgi:glucan 1,3-beta-glucosidase
MQYTWALYNQKLRKFNSALSICKYLHIARYMQQNPNALVPFAPDTRYNDPFFEQCSQYTCFKTYGLRIVDSNEIFVYGAGLYSFFDNYDQGCLITENCQEFMIQLDNSSEVYLYNPQTKASANIIAIDGVAVLSNQGLQSTFCQGAVYFEEP